MKKTVERERSQACLSFAERKPLRASLKRMFARVTMTLALMVFTTATAWADASEGKFTNFLPVSSGTATGYFTYSNHFYKVEWKNIHNTVGSVQLYWKTVSGVDVDQKVLEAKYENFLVDLYATATQDDRWQLSSITSLTPGQSSSGLSWNTNFASFTNTSDFVEVCTVTCMEVNTPTWSWSEDRSTCTATFTCTDDPDISKTVDATITTSADRKTASVTLNGTDYSVWIPDPAHFSVNDAGTEYTIHTAEGWGVFCDLLKDNAKGYFDNKTVKLGADIEVTRMAGGSDHDFTGTFDGDSHTLTVSYGSASEPVSDDDKAAPFRNVENGCVIKNLHVAGDIYTSKKYAGGLVGTQYGAVTIENCRVSTVIHSYTSGEGYHGGIVGHNGNASGSQLTIEGCVFDGKLLTEGSTATTKCGGFVGYSNDNKLSITQSLYAPAALSEGESEAASGSRTFVSNKSFNTTEKQNRYYTRALGSTNNQGRQALSITADEAVTVDFYGPTDRYTVSGITVYVGAGGRVENGLKYGDVLYAASSETVKLKLETTPEPPAGYQFGDYTASGGTLTPVNRYYTLAMPDQNVTISLTPIDWADVTTGDTEDTAYMIYNKGQLDMLAQRVNGGTSYSGKYFKLGADITYNYSGLGETESNYTRIGTSNYSFSGHFDGQNHVISGIRINGSGNCRGLFGYINGDGAEVKNVILADAVIKGNVGVGSIVGYISGGGKVTNCHVLSDVTIEGNQSVGGIVGINEGTVSDCLYLGTILEGNTDVGAIAGRNISTVKNCYYTDTAISGKDKNGNALDNAASAVGEKTGSTVTATGLAPQDTKDNSGFLTLMAQLNAALTAEERTTPLSTAVDLTLNGRTLYKDGAWNTLCLPFDVTIEGSVLDGEGVQAMTLNTKTSGLSSKGILTLNFVSAATIPAGTPFIIKWDESSTNIVNPMFHGVTVSDSTTNDATTDDGSLTFIGTYAPTDIYSADKVNLYLGAGNTLYYPSQEGFKVNAFRAYFHLNDASEANVRSIVLNFDGEATSITPLHAAVDAPSSAVYYTLDGRRLSGKPSARGMYIQGGKKLFIP